MNVKDMEKFKLPFPEKDIEWRLQSCGEKNGKYWGKALAYITSRAVQDRLDEVCGPDGWKTSIRREGDAYLCTLSIRVTHEDGTTEWVSREDGADSTDIEAVKGGISGAIKRAAVHFGIGRYLYNLSEGWANVSDEGKLSGKTKEEKWFKWDPPALPAWALPGGSGKPTDTDSKKSDNKTKDRPPASEEVKNKCKAIKDTLLDYEDIIPKDKWEKIDSAVDAGNVAYLESISAWCKKESEKKAG